MRIPEDVLYFEGDPVTEIFFIKKGMVNVVFGLDRGADSEFVVSRRSDGQHLGDVGLFVETKKGGGSKNEDDSDTNDDDDDDDYRDDRGARLFFSDDDEDAESEEETEYSPAGHFGGNEGDKGRVKYQKGRMGRRLNHISAVVTEFSEISSILASDFLQLLDQFPREKKLFRAVALARFKRMRHLVSTRLALLSGDLTQAEALEDAFFDSERDQTGKGGFGFIGRAMT